MNRGVIVPILCLLTLWAGGLSARADGVENGSQEILLYPGAAPGSEKWDWSERAVTTASGMPMAQDVVRPVLLHYPAEKSKAVGTAMIVAPGGGFRTLMMSYEGKDVATRLNAMGIDAFVLKYRLLYSGPGAPKVDRPKSSERPKRFVVAGAYKAQAGQDVIALAADDGRQAVRVLRERASELGFRPDRIGMIGYSAGGVVTSETLFGPTETRRASQRSFTGSAKLRRCPSPRLRSSSRSRRTTRSRLRGRSNCLRFTANRRVKRNFTSSRWARTDSSTKAAARTIIWTAWRNGSRRTSCLPNPRTETTPQTKTVFHERFDRT